MVSKPTLITGANGFIGRCLVNRLIENGDSVVALQRSLGSWSPAENPKLKLVLGDITKPADIEKAVAGCSQVYHLASLVDIWNQDPQQFLRVNVDGTKNLLIACQNAGVERILICSSCGIFGPSNSGELIDENKTVPVHSLNPYEKSKYLQRELALQFNSESLQTVIAYPTRVFGPGPKTPANSLTHLLYDAVRRQRCFVPGNGSSLGNYVFVDDVVQGLMLVMDRGKAGEGFIIGGANLTYVELIHHLGRATHRSISVWRIPKPILKTAAYLELLRSKMFRTRPGITPLAVDKYTANWPVSIAKAQRELGYEPKDIESAIKATMTNENWPIE